MDKSCGNVIEILIHRVGNLQGMVVFSVALDRIREILQAGRLVGHPPGVVACRRGTGKYRRSCLPFFWNSTFFATPVYIVRDIYVSIAHQVRRISL